MMILAMAYRLLSDEPVGAGICGIALEELDFAIAQLRTDDESRRDEGIHEARKCIKKLRGIVRLLMPGLGEAGAKDNITLRDTGRALSKLRDAAALIETVETLSEQHPTDPAMEQLAVVRSSLRRRLEHTVRGEDCRTVTGGAVAALKTVKRRVCKWQFAPTGEFATLAPGLEATYRRGRKALKRVQAEQTPENLHALRKRVKDSWYHVRLLDGALREIAEPRERSLGELQELLGDDHNLTVLKAALEAEPAAFGGKKAVPVVLQLIARVQADLESRALEAASRIYAEKPLVHALQLSAAFEAWHGKTGKPRPAASSRSKPVAKRGVSAA
jgi:CHAD domain-containing protein